MSASESGGSSQQNVPMTFKEPKDLIATLVALGLVPLPILKILKEVWEL